MEISNIPTLFQQSNLPSGKYAYSDEVKNTKLAHQINDSWLSLIFQGWEKTYVGQRSGGRRVCCHVLHWVIQVLKKTPQIFLSVLHLGLYGKFNFFCKRFSAGRPFISDEETKPGRSASINRANSFTSLNNSSRLWLTNRMLFDHPLYGLNIDRVLGFHEYTLGQVTRSHDFPSLSNINEYPNIRVSKLTGRRCCSWQQKILNFVVVSGKRSQVAATYLWGVKELRHFGKK